MGCASCSSSGGSPSGCGNKGHCLNGGCNKMNTYDWFSAWQVTDSEPFSIVEISFNNGTRKAFFRNKQPYQRSTGDHVAVDTGSGFDVGRISLSGEMVRLQMKKKHVQKDQIIHEVLRLASPRDMDRMYESRDREKKVLTRARAIVRSLLVDMKLGDVEFQADLRKATFYYTADGRVDFRELVRAFAREFSVKVEMRQIGSRQESARIGGIGSCGRELCCSTWLSDFKTVPTSAARYQNLAINQVKLSGQCGRLKCCLNYELDSYIDALKDFPTKVQTLKTKSLQASFIKSDIFKGVMHYGYKTEHGRFMVIAISKERVREISEMNKKGEFPELFITQEELELEQEMDFADVTGVIELKEEVKRKKKKRRRGNSRNRSSNSDQKPANKKQSNSDRRKPKSGSSQQNTQGASKGQSTSESDGNKEKKSKGSSRNNRNRNNRRRRPSNDKKTDDSSNSNTPKDN